MTRTIKGFAALGALILLASCQPTAGPEPDPGNAEVQAPSHQGKILLGRYRVEADPVAQTWEIFPLETPQGEALEGVGQLTQALADGNEAMSVAFGTQFSMVNCADGTCGCTAGDVPRWLGGICFPGQWLAFGRVQLRNLTTDRYFIDPAVVFENLEPNSGNDFLKFYTSFPAACLSTDEAAVRTVAPFTYYTRFNDVPPGGCDKGVDVWWASVVGAGDPAGAPDNPNSVQRFDVSLYVGALNPIQVLNGSFEDGLNNWTVGDGQVEVVDEHCSHTSDFSCQAGENGIGAPPGDPPPTGTGQFARVINVVGPSFVGQLVSDPFVLQAGVLNLSFDFKFGSREPGTCSAQNNDRFFVEVTKNGGADWDRVPLPAASDLDADGMLELQDDCAAFAPIGLGEVFEVPWEPGSVSQPRVWTSHQADISALGYAADDTIQVRFVVEPGDEIGIQNFESVALVDNVQMVP